MTQPVASASSRDGKVWRDDSVEILINRLEPRGDWDFTHLILNTAETLFDKAGGKTDWNGITQWAVQHHDKGWTAELVIPLQDEKGLSSSPGALRFNIIRNVQKTTYNQAEISTWYPVWAANAEMQARGILILQ